MTELLPFEKALELVLNNTNSSGISEIDIEKSLNYVIAEDIFADRDYPPFNRSGMDGYALLHDDLSGNGKTFKIMDTVFAGSKSKAIAERGSCVKIMTGAPVPDGLDVVVKIEDSQKDGKNVHFQNENFDRWKNIAKKGEDAQKGALIIKKGAIVTNVIMGIAAGLGYSKIRVYEKPKVSLITTGNEIVPIDKDLEFYQIRNTNFYTIQALLNYLQIPITFHSHVRDEKEKLMEKIKKGLDSDILIITGGVSAGDTDYVPFLLEKAGVKKIFHKLKVRPGKPIWFGKKDNGTAVFGLPGNPVSCQAGFKMFVEPYIQKSMEFVQERKLRLPLAKEYTKKHALTEFVNCKKLIDSNSTSIMPISGHGSGDYISIKESQGLFVMPENQKILKEGIMVDFYPWKNI